MASLFKKNKKRQRKNLTSLYFGLSGTRTHDQLIKSQLLYQLSYKPVINDNNYNSENINNQYSIVKQFANIGIL